MDYDAALERLERQGDLIRESLVMLKAVEDRLKSAEKALAKIGYAPEGMCGPTLHECVVIARAHMEKYHGR